VASGKRATKTLFSQSITIAPQPVVNGKIAFVSYRFYSYEIYIINTDGSGLMNLSNNDAYDADPVFSPDGSKIAFESSRDGNREIYIMNADGSGQTRPYQQRPQMDYPRNLSPDGQQDRFRSHSRRQL
jgi:TolB protein